jgi:hypothetical protein
VWALSGIAKSRFPTHNFNVCKTPKSRCFQIHRHASLQSNGSDRVGKSQIAISLCMSFTTPETPICRTPIPRDPLTRVHEMNGSDLIGKSRIAISCCTISLPSKTPISRSATFARSLTPVPCVGRLRSRRDFQPIFPDLSSTETPISRCTNTDGADHRHVSSPMDGPDPIGKSRIAISTCSSLLSSETPIRRSPTLPRLLTPVYQMNGSDLVGKSRFAIPCDMIFVCPNTPIPDSRLFPRF